MEISYRERRWVEHVLQSDFGDYDFVDDGYDSCAFPSETETEDH